MLNFSRIAPGPISFQRTDPQLSGDPLFDGWQTWVVASISGNAQGRQVERRRVVISRREYFSLSLNVLHPADS